MVSLWHPQPSHVPTPGIWSTGDLERDAEVARVPWKLLLTRASAQDALSLSSGVGEYPSMALQLIHEKLRKIQFFEGFWVKLLFRPKFSFIMSCF